jgi:hypothetical protein
MSKSRKQILLELLELESENLGEVGKSDEKPTDAVNSSQVQSPPVTEDAVEEPITKPKKKLTEKQLEVLRKGQQKRDENARMRAELRARQEADEQKLKEEKIVKKAIAIKKKQIKKNAVLDEISDDDTPLEKIKEIAVKENKGTDGSLRNPPLKEEPPKKLFHFF